MIEKKILLLKATDQNNNPLNRYPGLYLQRTYDQRNWEYGLKSIFSNVLVFDYYATFVNDGIIKANENIIEIIKKEKPQLLIWPVLAFEILESTLQRARSLKCDTLAFFFDDNFRFEGLSKFYIPYLDYIITCDSINSQKKYTDIGAHAEFLLNLPSREFFTKKNLSFKYDVSFVGSNILDRFELIKKINNSGINIQTFGVGWSSGHISTESMINIFNESKINLNFVKGFGTAYKNNQFKGRIFEICICGGFLMTEYMPELADYFKIDDEIVTFSTAEEATDKIRYYLKNEVLRQKIASAGYEKVKNNYSLEKLWHDYFLLINDKKSSRNHLTHIQVTEKSKTLRGRWHLSMASAYFLEEEKKKCTEHLIIARKYLSFNIEYFILSTLIYFPKFLRKILYRLYILIVNLLTKNIIIKALKKIKNFI